MKIQLNGEPYESTGAITVAELLERLQACANATGWDVSRARDWWAEHGEGVAAQREEAPVTDDNRTIAVNLVRNR